MLNFSPRENLKWQAIHVFSTYKIRHAFSQETEAAKAQSLRSILVEKRLKGVGAGEGKIEEEERLDIDNRTFSALNLKIR